MRTSAVIVLALAFAVVANGQGLPRRLMQWGSRFNGQLTTLPVSWGANYNYGVGVANGLGGGSGNSGSGCLGNIDCISAGTASSGNTGNGAAWGVGHNVLINAPGIGNWANSGSQAGNFGNSNAAAGGFGALTGPSGSASNLWAAFGR